MESTGSARTRRTTAAAKRPAAATPEIDPSQLEADADELDTECRYLRHRAFVELIAEAVRRAEAMTRLEVALTLQAH